MKVQIESDDTGDLALFIQALELQINKDIKAFKSIKISNIDPWTDQYGRTHRFTIEFELLPVIKN